MQVYFLCFQIMSELLKMCVLVQSFLNRLIINIWLFHYKELDAYNDNPIKTSLTVQHLFQISASLSRCRRSHIVDDISVKRRWTIVFSTFSACATCLPSSTPKISPSLLLACLNEEVFLHFTPCHIMCCCNRDWERRRRRQELIWRQTLEMGRRWRFADWDHQPGQR